MSTESAYAADPTKDPANAASTATRLALYRRPAIRHEPVQCYLRLFWPAKIAGLKHLAIILDHLLDIDRVMLAVVRAIVIDAADVFILPGQFS